MCVCESKCTRGAGSWNWSGQTVVSHPRGCKDLNSSLCKRSACIKVHSRLCSLGRPRFTERFGYWRLLSLCSLYSACFIHVEVTRALSTLKVFQNKPLGHEIIQRETSWWKQTRKRLKIKWLEPSGPGTGYCNELSIRSAWCLTPLYCVSVPGWGKGPLCP